MSAFADRVSYEELSAQLPALLPCVLTGMADLKAAEIRRLSIAAAAKQLALVVRKPLTITSFAESSSRSGSITTSLPAHCLAARAALPRD